MIGESPVISPINSLVLKFKPLKIIVWVWPKLYSKICVLHVNYL